tara:strand:- start:1195 stop:2178 length:984 start_codon:yes stop_codon:yes gene_type:complete
VTQAWPRYEAEYLRRALLSEKHKYATTGLDREQKQIYLDQVTRDYKEEADEALKGEFDQWLQGLHEANDPEGDSVYVNAEGKPVRRWTMRNKEAQDAEGGSKVGQARAGWKHTPWGRQSLTHLPGVSTYLAEQKRNGMDADTRMQMLAEFGPQSLEDAWKYFKHWVKGRPVTDAVTLPPHFDHQSTLSRSDFKGQMPHSMYEYRVDQPDAQPGVLASDANAYNAAAARSYEEAPNEAAFKSHENEAREAQLLATRQFRERLQNAASREGHAGENEAVAREEAAERAQVADEVRGDVIAEDLKHEQRTRDEQLRGRADSLLPALFSKV